MAFTERIVHKKYRILTDPINDIYDRISFWRKAEDIELSDGSDLDTKLSDMTTAITRSFTNFATVEATTTASQPYVKGNMLIYADQLYRVIATIPSGVTIVLMGAGANVEVISVSTLSSMLTASDGAIFDFDVVDGHYGFYTDSARTNFVPIT